MATSTCLAKENILCKLCKKSAVLFCNSCQANLCMSPTCVIKHVENDLPSHDIGALKIKDLQLVFPECEVHPGHKCEAYCQECKTPICTNCLIGTHKGHDAELLSAFVERKKQKITEETEKIKGIIPQYETIDDEIQTKMSKTTEEYEKIEQEKERWRHLWHQEVDVIFDMFGTLIHSMKDNDLTPLKINQAKVKNKIKELDQTVKKHNDILKSNKVNEVMKYIYMYACKLNEHKEFETDLDVKLPSMVTKIVPGRGLRIEIGGIKAALIRTVPTDHFSCLSTEKLVKEARVIATIPLDIFPRNKYKVACVGGDEAWIGGDNTPLIKRIDIKGSVKNKITCKNPPRDISVTKHGDLVFTDSVDNSVYIIRHGVAQKLITTPENWSPWGISCTRSGDILVGVFYAVKNKIIKYHGQKITQEIYQDEHGNPIFSEGYCMLYIAENNNGDICVSDSNANSVVVMERTGKVLFHYNGTGSKRKKQFAPGCIVTNSRNQIIVTDIRNDCLHILDQHGKFVSCVDNCELDNLCGLDLDDEGRLWVGLYKSRKIKVIEYL